MADCRLVKCSLYDDDKFSELSSENKLLYLYLITNIRTNTCGCYKIKFGNIAVDTGLSKEKVDRGINDLCESNLIMCSKKTNEILIIDWKDSNWNSSPIIKERLNKEIEMIDDADFKRILTDWKEEHDVKTKSVKKTAGTVKNDLFDKIWELYPKKTNKSKVTAEAIKEVCEVGFEKMKACIDNYKKSIENVEDKYVLGGDTFFNGRYKDFFDDVTVDRSDKDKKRLKTRVTDAYMSIIKNFPAELMDGNEKEYFWDAIKDLKDTDAIINEADRIKLYLDENGKQKIPFKEFMEQWLKQKKA